MVTVSNMTMLFQDAILSQLTSMQGRINSLEAKNAPGPVLNTQPLQMPYGQYGQYGFINPKGSDDERAAAAWFQHGTAAQFFGFNRSSWARSRSKCARKRPGHPSELGEEQ